MQSKYYGQIDLTLVGEIIRQQPNLIHKSINKKDGKEHQYINVSVLVGEEPNQWGNIASIRVDVKKEEQKDNVRYYVANLKPSAKTQPQSNFDDPLPPLGEKLPF